MMVIPRDLYLDRLIQRKHNGLVKVITGIRRCGKSYLLNRLFYEHLLASGVAPSHIIRFAFDSADDLGMIGEDILDLETEKRGADPKKFLSYINDKISDGGQYYLLLDEIQMLDCFVPVLNGFLRKDNLDIYVTGSNARLLSKDIATEFAGRGDEVHIWPLSYAEFYSVCGSNRQEAFAEYMMYGGIPLVALRQTDEEKVATLHNLFSEIYLRDIQRRSNIEKVGELEDLLNILASGIGSLTNPQKLQNTFRSVKKSNISTETIVEYLNLLEDSFLIDSAHRYDIKGRAYVNAPLKYYFSDLGLRNARINFRQVEPTHSMENIIYNELRMRGYNVDVGVVPVGKPKDSAEIHLELEVDFVCNLGDKRYYIQSAFSLPDAAKREQEIRPLRNIDDSFKKIVVTNDVVKPYYDDFGIQTLNICDFLLDPGYMGK